LAAVKGTYKLAAHKSEFGKGLDNWRKLDNDRSSGGYSAV